MNYNKIKEELEKFGYLSFIRKNLEDKYVFSGVPDELTLMKPNYSFNIFIVDNKIIINYFIGHLLKSDEFSTLKELIDFIKVEFPIK